MDLPSANTTNLDSNLENKMSNFTSPSGNFFMTKGNPWSYGSNPVYRVKANKDTVLENNTGHKLAIKQGDVGTFQRVITKDYPYVVDAKFKNTTIRLWYKPSANGELEPVLLKNNAFSILSVDGKENTFSPSKLNMTGYTNYHTPTQNVNFAYSSAAGYKAPFEMNSSADGGGVVTPQTVKAGLDLAKSIQQRRAINPCKRPLVRETFFNHKKWAEYRDCLAREERKRQQEIDAANAKAQQKAYETQAILAGRGDNPYGTSNDKILGMSKHVALGLGVVLIAGLGFIAYKVIKNRQAVAATIAVAK